MNFFDGLRSRANDRSSRKAETFQELIAMIVEGAELDEDEALNILRVTGHDIDDLFRAVTTEFKRTCLEAEISENPEALAERTRIEAEISEMDRDYREVAQRFIDKSRELHEALRSAHKRLASIDAARAELANMPTREEVAAQRGNHQAPPSDTEIVLQRQSQLNADMQALDRRLTELRDARLKLSHN